VQYSEVIKEEVRSRSAKGIKGGTGGAVSSSFPAHTASVQHQSAQLVGQQSHSHKPYRPLGDMRSVLSLKIALIKEDHLTGEKMKRYLGRKNGKKGLAAEDDDEDEEDEGDEGNKFKPVPPEGKRRDSGHLNGGAGSLKQTSSSGSASSPRPSMHRVLTLSRSPAYKLITGRIREGTMVKKYVSAGTPLKDHVRQRDESECIDHAMRMVGGDTGGLKKGNQAANEAENEVFTGVENLELGGLVGGGGGMLREESTSSLMSESTEAGSRTFVTGMDGGGGSPRGRQRGGILRNNVSKAGKKEGKAFSEFVNVVKEEVSKGSERSEGSERSKSRERSELLNAILYDKTNPPLLVASLILGERRLSRCRFQVV